MKKVDNNLITYEPALLQNKFLEILLSGTDIFTNFDKSFSRALLYWDSYIELYKAVKKNKNIGKKIIEINNALVDKIITTPLDCEESDWTAILCLMLSSASGNSKKEQGEIGRKLRLLYEQRNDLDGREKEIKTGTRKYIKNNIYFNYRFTAAFQDWILYHIQEEWYMREEREYPPICQDCKAKVPPGSPTNDIINLFYSDVNNSNQTFQSIFGRTARSIHGQKYQGEPLSSIPLLSKYFPTSEIAEKECLLWSELIWLMDEIENLSIVHSRVQKAQKRMETLLLKASNPSELPVNVFKEDTELNDWVFSRLRVNQISLFVSNISNKRHINKIAFDTTDVIERKLNIILSQPDISNDKQGKIKVFEKIIKQLFENTLEKGFFKKIEDISSSSTDKHRTFPFIVIPDGEVNLYYSLMLYYQKEKQLNYFIKEDDDIFKEKITMSPTDYWKLPEWWGIKVGTGGIFPNADTEGNGLLHHRCCSYVSVAHMCSGQQEERLINFKCALQAIRSNFCQGTTPEDTLNKVYYGHCSDTKCVNFSKHENIGDQYSFNDLITTPRINYLPEIFLRAGEEEAQTLFFLPLGAKALKTDEKSYLPLSMIAGTLHGVEKRWLPFNSYRIVAHLYPIIQIFQPLIDKLSMEIYLEGALSNENEVAHKKHAEEEKKRADFLQKNFTDIDHYVDELTKAAHKIRKEIFPAPSLFCKNPNIASSLSALFFPGQPKDIDLKNLFKNFKEFKKNAQKLFPDITVATFGFSKDFTTFHAIHNPAPSFNTFRADGVNYTKAMLYILKWYMDSDSSDHNLNKYMFVPLFEITNEKNCISVLQLLKDYIHNSQLKNEIVPWSFIIPIVLESYINKSPVTLKLSNEEFSIPNYFDSNILINVWKKILSLSNKELVLHDKYKYKGSGWLANALYGLFFGPMKYNGDSDSAQIKNIEVFFNKNTDQNYKLELIISGIGCFSSEHVFFGEDEEERDLRTNIKIFSDSVGVNLPTIYRVGSQNFDPDDNFLKALHLNNFSIVQWSINKNENKFRMGIRYGENL